MNDIYINDKIKKFIQILVTHEIYNKICNNYLESFKDLNHMRDVLLAGRQTIEAMKNISTGVNWRNFLYSKTAGGNGGLMRTMCIGLAFHQTTSLLKLIPPVLRIIVLLLRIKLSRLDRAIPLFLVIVLLIMLGTSILFL